MQRAPPTCDCTISAQFLSEPSGSVAETHFNHLLWFRFGLPSPGRSCASQPAIGRAMDEATAFSSGVLQPLIRTCLMTEDPPLSAELCKGLIEEPTAVSLSSVPPNSISENDPVTSGTLVGYPDYPLYKRLSDSIANWMVTGRCPVLEQPEMYMLNEQDSLSDRSERLEAAGRKLSGAYSLWQDWSEDERQATLLEFLKSLCVRGVLDLLGVRKTVGSSDCLPPSKEALLATFTAPHHPNSKLSVGARALAKHCHRDDSLQWWGECTGSEEDKNSHALDRALTIMREAAWINIHSLPHDVKVIEMRTREGYGVRWLHDGSEFRGFLEPQMEDGHLVGWRH